MAFDRHGVSVGPDLMAPGAGRGLAPPLSFWTRYRSRAVGAVWRLRSLDLADALCVLILVVAASALVVAIVNRGFDYDEVEHVHAAWLISRGLRPFYDFFECHPPFLWYPHALLFKVFGDSYDLPIVFRFIATLG